MSSSDPDPAPGANGPATPAAPIWPRPEAMVLTREEQAETTDLVELTIAARTPYTEIRVLNARFEPEPLPANVGSVHLHARPGIYEVGFRVGDDWETKQVVLDPGAPGETVTQSAAADRSAEMPAEPACAALPTATLVVEFISAEPGTVKVVLISAQDDTQLPPDLVPGAPMLCQFAAAPGYWRLRFDERLTREPFEIPMTIVAGYTAYVSVPLRDTSEGRCVDLELMRFRLIPSGAPLAVSPSLLSFEESAYAALRAGRTIYGPEVDRLIDELQQDSASNPVLGMFAAHLCDLSRDSEFGFQERLLGWLEKVTGGPGQHPDVTALRLGFLRRTGRDLTQVPPQPFPPIMTASWRLLLEAAREEPALIPAGSFSDRIADRVWASSQFIAWTAPPMAEASPMASSPVTPGANKARSLAPQVIATALSDVASVTAGGMIVSGLAHAALRQWLRKATTEQQGHTRGLEWDHPDMVSSAELAVATALYPLAPTEDFQEKFERFAVQYATSRPNPHEPAGTANALARLGLPPATIERALGSLASKLSDRAGDFKIEL